MPKNKINKLLNKLAGSVLTMMLENILNNRKLRILNWPVFLFIYIHKC